MTNARKTNQAGIDIVKEFESCRLKAYRCAAGVPTIGWGHTKGIRMGQTITQAQADAYLVEDLEEFEEAVERYVAAPLNDNEFSALVSLVFNIGPSAFLHSTLLYRLNRGWRKLAADQFLVWNKGTVKGKKVVLRGLVRRRAAERELFLKP